MMDTEKGLGAMNLMTLSAEFWRGVPFVSCGLTLWRIAPRPIHRTSYPWFF